VEMKLAQVDLDAARAELEGAKRRLDYQLTHRQRSTAPTPFAGLPQPPCALGEQEAAHPQAPPPVPPEPRPPTHRRPRPVDTSRHFCPHAGCRYRGGLGLGTLRATGPPHGGPGRPWQCLGGPGYLLEPHGTLLPGTQAAIALRVGVLACLAEGVDSRATARVCEAAPPPACPGWWKPRSSAKPSPPLACVTFTGAHGTSTSCTQGPGRSKRAS
jgi:hypothetical protein